MFTVVDDTLQTSLHSWCLVVTETHPYFLRYGQSLRESPQLEALAFLGNRVTF